MHHQQAAARGRIRADLAKGLYNPEIVSIEPLHPLAVQPMRVGDRLCYYLMYTNEILDQDDILHFTGIGYEIPIVNPKLAKVYGYRSMSPLKYALRYAGGIALAADQFSANFSAMAANLSSSSRRKRPS